MDDLIKKSLVLKSKKQVTTANKVEIEWSNFGNRWFKIKDLNTDDPETAKIVAGSARSIIETEL